MGGADHQIRPAFPFKPPLQVLISLFGLQNHSIWIGQPIEQRLF